MTGLPHASIPRGDGPVDSGAVATARAALAAAELATRLQTLADGLRAAATVYPKVPPHDWRGPAATGAALALAVDRTSFGAAADACRTAGIQLGRHAQSLAAAADLRRRSENAPPELVAALRERADAAVTGTAGPTARTLLGLAGQAPARASRWDRQIGAARSGGAEILLGTGESVGQLLGGAVTIGAFVTGLGDRDTNDDLRSAYSGARQALGALGHDPKGVFGALVDWDTWRSNPARAIGHLVPDAVAAALSGGAAVAPRAAAVARRSAAALEAGQARVASRAAAQAVAAESRDGLVESALRATARAGEPDWLGEGATRLSARDAAQTRAYLALSQAQEGDIVDLLGDIVPAGDGSLVKLGTALKGADSTLRKVATELGNTGQGLPELLTNLKDATRFTAVIDDRDYTAGARAIAGLLESAGYRLYGEPKNAWINGRTGYRGVNTNWIDPRTGAVFELQFHTPRSFIAGERTHRPYEELRLPDVTPADAARLKAQIDAEYERARPPKGVRDLFTGGFPPDSDPFRPVVNYVLVAGAGAAVGTQAAAQASRASQGASVADQRDRRRAGR